MSGPWAGTASVSMGSLAPSVRSALTCRETTSHVHNRSRNSTNLLVISANFASTNFPKQFRALLTTIRGSKIAPGRRKSVPNPLNLNGTLQWPVQRL